MTSRQGVIGGVAAEEKLIWQSVIIVLLFLWAEYSLDTNLKPERRL